VLAGTADERPPLHGCSRVAAMPLSGHTVGPKRRDATGRLAGTVIVMKPDGSMANPAWVITQSDPRRSRGGRPDHR